MNTYMKIKDTLCRFFDYSFSVHTDESITFHELESQELQIKPGDGFMAFVDPLTDEVTLKKINLLDVQNITATMVK